MPPKCVAMSQHVALRVVSNATQTSLLPPSFYPPFSLRFLTFSFTKINPLRTLIISHQTRLVYILLTYRVVFQRVAIPLFGTRVAPRCCFAPTLLVAMLSEGKVTATEIISTEGLNLDQRLQLLLDLNIHTFVTGGIDLEFFEKVKAHGINVIANVAGETQEVLKELAEGRLEPWFGYEHIKKGTPEAPTKSSEALSPPTIESSPLSLTTIDCTRCLDRRCLKGADCVGVREVGQRESASPHTAELIEMATYVAGVACAPMSRCEEFIELALGLKYKRIGLAFCVELFREAEILAEILRKHFEVVPVCCKVGGVSKEEWTPSRVSSAPSFEPACNPVGQAKALNLSRCEFVATVGLCIGMDSVLAKHLVAPSTPLIVKDRLMANNPVGLLYSKYHLKNILEGF